MKELLEQLAKRIEGAEFCDGGHAVSIPFPSYGCNRILDGQFLDIGDHPWICFDLLDRMESAGIFPAGPFVGWEPSRLQYACFGTPGISHGKTRTEAIVRLFVAVMPEIAIQKAVGRRND